MFENYFREAQKYFFDFEGKEKNKALQSLLEDIENIDPLPDEGEYFYLLGYIKYLKGERSKEVVSLFKKSIAIEDNVFVKYYLGLLYYDIEDYVNSKQTFLAINKASLIKLGQLWRIQKIDEMILCCRFWLQEPNDFIELNKNVSEHFEFIFDSNLNDPINSVFPGDIIISFFNYLNKHNHYINIWRKSKSMIKMNLVCFSLEIWDEYQKEFEFFDKNEMF